MSLRVAVVASILIGCSRKSNELTTQGHGLGMTLPQFSAHPSPIIFIVM